MTCSCGESSTTKTVRVYVHHPEHVRAVEVTRSPVIRTRTERVSLSPAPVNGPARVLGLAADAPYQLLDGSAAHAGAAPGGADAGGRFRLVELAAEGLAMVRLAVVGRLATSLFYSGLALASVAATGPEAKEAEMLAAFDAVLTGMAYAGAGLCFFAIVWAGFLLMAEGAEGEGNRGRARNAVLMAVVGLVLVLLAKGITAAINSRVIEVLPGV